MVIDKEHFLNRNTELEVYPTITRMREITHSTHWYVLNLDLTGAELYAGDAYLWLTHPNWGRIRNTNPRRKPVKNPPI